MGLSMTCETVEREEIAEKYVGGRLDAGAQDRFEVHMLECRHCLQRVEVLEGLRAELEVRAGAIRVQPSRSRWTWLLMPAAAAIVIACAALLAHRASRRNAVPAATQSQATTAAPPVPKQPPTPPEVAQAPEGQRTGPPSPPARTLAGTPSVPPATPPAQPSSELAVAPQRPAEGSGAQVARAAKPKPQAPALSEQVAGELFRAGLVEPPPYTFSGLTAKKEPGQTKPGTKQGLKTGSTPAADLARGLFQRGMQAYVAGHYNAAAESLQAALENDPTAPDVNFYLGICRLMQGRPAQAVPPLQTVVVNRKSNHVQAAYFYLAKAHIQMNELEVAERELQQAIAVPGPLSAESRSLFDRIRALRPQVEAPAAPPR